MPTYLDYLVIKALFFVLEPQATVTYDRANDFINVE